MSFPAYPKYKDSGVEWLGQVPEHWSVQSCRAIVTERTTKNDDGESENYLSLMANIGIIPYEEKGDVGNKKPEDLTKCKMVRIGDFVINSMNYYIGSYGISRYEGICSPVYIVLTPQSDVVEPRFAFRIFEDKRFQQHAQSFGNGILEHRRSINWDILKVIHAPVPPTHEQLGILNFLDRETSKIDALVAEQRKLIGLLKEKRQAVISHAVTKGLNPDVPMKHSGIEWLGMVPEHWSVVTVKRGITKMSQGSSPQCHSEPASQGEWGVVKVGCCNKFELNESEQKRLPPEIAPLTQYEIQNGDILMSRGNTLELVGMAALVSDVRPRLLLCDLVYRFRPVNDVFDAAFLVHSLRSKNVRSQIESDAVGSSSTMKKVSQELVRNLLVCHPPLREQQEISNHLANICDEFDTLEAEADRSIDFLQERRTALISATVTGKIDVRNLAFPLQFESKVDHATARIRVGTSHRAGRSCRH